VSQSRSAPSERHQLLHGAETSNCSEYFIVNSVLQKNKHNALSKEGNFVDVIKDAGGALTSPTGGGRSVGIVRSRTKATEFSLGGGEVLSAVQ